MIALERSFDDDLADAAAYHGHLCVGQFTGVRMARYGCALLGIAQPRLCRDLFVFVETDRCVVDAISTVTGCKPGKRRLKLIDYGKSAAVFLNHATGEAVRVASKDWISLGNDADIRAFFDAQTDEALFSVKKVEVALAPEDLPGKPLERVRCADCGEYITDRRAVLQNGAVRCKACANGAYYTTSHT